MMSDLLASPCPRNMIRCRSQLFLPPPHTLTQQQCGDKLMLSECHWWLELVLRHFPWYEKWHGTFSGFSLFTAEERWRWHFHSQPFQDSTRVLSQAHCLVRIFTIFSLHLYHQQSNRFSIHFSVNMNGLDKKTQAFDITREYSIRRFSSSAIFHSPFNYPARSISLYANWEILWSLHFVAFSN